MDGERAAEQCAAAGPAQATTHAGKADGAVASKAEQLDQRTRPLMARAADGCGHKESAAPGRFYEGGERAIAQGGWDVVR